ncbi:hypothetical protein [Salipiger mucosus]|uniref:Uncharacterized protein n=1 Tax=Salipiger mucosus DSM 16094 TaxID=1123237 RepID=S9Q3K5_9RHOB|nr:hypothetical protein [Salipiger mucosus]EPX75916.1 hypothetical protein Salmuc_02312 [Salipiger mucosus DSM 16094]
MLSFLMPFLFRVLLVMVVYELMRHVPSYYDMPRRRRALTFGGILAVTLLPFGLALALFHLP